MSSSLLLRQDTPLPGQANIGRLAPTYIQQLCADTGSSLEDTREWWTIETSEEQGSEKSVIATQHDDVDDDRNNVEMKTSDWKEDRSNNGSRVLPEAMGWKRSIKHTKLTRKSS